MFGVIEEIISEEGLGTEGFYKNLKERIRKELSALSADPELLENRYQRFRRLGTDPEWEAAGPGF
jgi:acetyl-CoA carboxylase carboxyl transferase subunit alpha